MNKKLTLVLLPVAFFLCFGAGISFADKPRARALGIPFDGAPGIYNAISDVGGVTGMICHGYKYGAGASSRIVRIEDTSYVLGAMHCRLKR